MAVIEGFNDIKFNFEWDNETPEHLKEGESNAEGYN